MINNYAFTLSLELIIFWLKIIMNCKTFNKCYYYESIKSHLWLKIKDFLLWDSIISYIIFKSIKIVFRHISLPMEKPHWLKIEFMVHWLNHSEIKFYC